jgi:uncharacterized protein YdhG (YjbR/CyaY superfamily)
MAKPVTVDQYIESFPDQARGCLEELRDLSRAHAPEATETLKWGAPAYSVETILFVFAGFTKHANFVFTPSTREAFAIELSSFKTGKGSVQLPYAEPMPTELLGRMIEYRVQEFEVDGIRWM